MHRTPSTGGISPPHRPHGTGRHTRRARGGRLLTVLTGTSSLVLTTLVVAPPAHAFSGTSYAGSALRGAAHGGNALLTSSTATVKVGDIARQSMRCNPVLGQETSAEADDATSQINFVGSIVLPLPSDTTKLVLKASQLRNSGYATAGENRADVYEKATSSNVTLLAGMISATTVQQTAHTSISAAGKLSDGAIVVQDLLIDPDGSGPTNASPIENPAPNTRIDLPNVGYVVINEQYTDAAGFKANALHVHVGADPGDSFFGFRGDLLVAHVETSASKSPARISAFAYASKGSVSPFLKSGLQAINNLPCGGTKGLDKEVTGAGLKLAGSADVPTLLDEKGLHSVVNGRIKLDDNKTVQPYARSTETIESLNLLVDKAGVPLVSATALKVVASTHAVKDADGNPITGIQSAGSMTFASLVIGGQAVDPPAPGVSQTFALGDFGKLVINEQRCRDAAALGTGHAVCTSVTDGVDSHYNAITVTGLHLTIFKQNVAGLPVGADISIAVAHTDMAF